VNSETTDCVNVILEKVLEGLPDKEGGHGAGGILAMILGIDKSIESLVEMFQEVALSSDRPWHCLIPSLMLCI
jgi:hypothetical protein